eukprot:snap_masked-scaffold_1-processed-gene-4.33-mRNA-1 protein AED:0.09 eAED:1.00 QI:0/-1/0/1/-1/1/1/0/527
MHFSISSLSSYAEKTPRRKSYSDEALIIDLGGEFVRFYFVNNQFSLPESVALSSSVQFKTFRGKHMMLLPPILSRQKIKKGISKSSQGSPPYKFGFDAVKELTKYTFLRSQKAEKGEMEDNRVSSSDIPLMVRMPLSSGTMTADSFPKTKRLFRHAFDILSTPPSKFRPDDTPIVLIEPTGLTRDGREQFAEILSSFLIPAFYMIPSPVASLRSFRPMNNLSGVVIDFGDSKTSVCVVLEGEVVPETMAISGLAGNSLSQYMQRLIIQRGRFSAKDSRAVTIQRAKRIKEEYGVLAGSYEEFESYKDEVRGYGQNLASQETFVNDYDSEFDLGDTMEQTGTISMNQIKNLSCDISEELGFDGTTPLKIDFERFEVCEPLFTPKLMGYDESDGILGLFKQSFEAFQQVKEAHPNIPKFQGLVSKFIFRDVFVVGGGSNVTGLEARLRKMIISELLSHERNSPEFSGDSSDQILRRLEENVKISLHAHSQERSYATIIGTKFRIEESENSEWVSDVEFEQNPQTVLHRF